MPSQPDSHNEGERESLLHNGERRARRAWSGFVDFALQGNFLDVAFGLILASTFTSVVKSFVNDILLPPLSVILPLNRNMNEKFAILKPGPHCDEMDGYNTVQQARDDGAVIMAYGIFVSDVINFLALGLSLYSLAALYQCLTKDTVIKRTIKCKYCRKRVNEKALRCFNCSSWLDGREDQYQ